MKKIFIFIIVLCLLFGSNNYQDLGQISIITNIGINHTNDHYEMIFQEVIPQKNDNKISNRYTYYTSQGSTINECFKNIDESITKEVYLNYLENIIINSYDEEIFTYFSKNLGDDLDNFNIVYTNSDIEKVIKYKNNYNYINRIIPKKTTYQQMRKNRLEHKKTKIPFLTFKDQKLIFYKYIRR